MSAPLTPEQIAEARVAFERAHEEIGDLARLGRDRWRMTIPAAPGRDSDLILSAGLDAGEQALAEVERLTRERDEARAALAQMTAAVQRAAKADDPTPILYAALHAVKRPEAQRRLEDDLRELAMLRRTVDAVTAERDMVADAAGVPSAALAQAAHERDEARAELYQAHRHLDAVYRERSEAERDTARAIAERDEARAKAERHLGHLREAFPRHFTPNVLGQRLCGCDGQWPCREQTALQAELDEARAARDRVHALHPREQHHDDWDDTDVTVCGYCRDTSEDPVTWPCDTIRAIGEQP